MAVPAAHAATPELNSAVQAARTDAAHRTGAAAASIELVKAEGVTWPDSSLGCPQPGMGYMQTLVPGYRIRLRAKGVVLDYHASQSGKLVLCPASRSVKPLPDSRS
jgi:hypothetical protein